MKNFVNLRKISIILLLINLILIINVNAKRTDGQFARLLDEYHSLTKCMLNNLEELIPKLTDYMKCCGFWNGYDFMHVKVAEECTESDLQQFEKVSEPIVDLLRGQCHDYLQGSFKCRMMVFLPVIGIIFFIILILSITICAIISLSKWITFRRKYRKVANITSQATDLSLISNEKKRFQADQNEYDNFHPEYNGKSP